MARWYYRIVQRQRVGSAMDGEGARLYGGRWNPPGMAAVYLAATRSLAMVEILVHAPREALSVEWSVIPVGIPEAGIQTVEEKDLPAGWRDLPWSASARQFGKQWLEQGQSLALEIPSAVVPEESVVLINPRHPEFSSLEIAEPERFSFDPGLHRGG